MHIGANGKKIHTTGQFSAISHGQQRAKNGDPDQTQ